MAQGEYKKAISDRFSSVRARTWSITLALIVMLIFFYIMNVTTKQAMSWIDFLMLSFVQVVAHSIYFPDGEIFGMKDETFINNRTAYNTKADNINQQRKHEQLRTFCDVDFEERKKRYLLNQLGYIGISFEEFKQLKQKDEKEIKSIKRFETTEIIDNEEIPKVVQFGRKKRKILFDLIFKPLPVEKNNSETIMSAVENDGTKAIKDTSVAYKRHNYMRKFLQAILIGGILAYVAYTARDGIGLAEITAIIMCIGSLFITAALAFSAGEQCTKVYKNRFYLELVNFIDEFNEWDLKVVHERQEKIIQVFTKKGQTNKETTIKKPRKVKKRAVK